MQIASTQRAAFNSNKDLTAARHGCWQMLQLNLAGGSMKDSRE
jgi:hypothetical protein